MDEIKNLWKDNKKVININEQLKTPHKLQQKFGIKSSITALFLY